jgi:cytochrome c oxidase cbb3-type subunit I/II
MSSTTLSLPHEGGVNVDRFYYDNKIVKMFMYATILWGVVGMLAGLYASIELFFPCSKS